MPRAIWSGSVSFGLVNVPVKLYPAVRRKEIHFHQLHAADGARIQLRRVCTEDGSEVTWDDLVKGYEVAPGQDVVVTEEELGALDPQATRTIDIEDFVGLEEIDPLYFDTSYYLVPDGRVTKPYRLLVDAMESETKVAIARFVLRTKQHLCALRAVEGALVLSTLHYADEVVVREDLDGLPGPADASDRELSMARRLIESLTTGFEPDRYRDTYREQVMELVEAKAEGKEIVGRPPEQKAAIIDLAEALEASLAAAEAGGGEKAEPAKRRTGPRRGRKAS
ncbi:MAG: Ku protein [Acidimicrobiales bacterium]